MFCTYLTIFQSSESYNFKQTWYRITMTLVYKFRGRLNLFSQPRRNQRKNIQESNSTFLLKSFTMSSKILVIFMAVFSLWSIAGQLMSMSYNL